MCILRENVQFSSYRGQNFDKYMHLRQKENQIYYHQPSFDSIFRLKKVIEIALVRFEELDAVRNAPLHSAAGGKIGILTCFWFQADGAQFCLRLVFIHMIGHKFHFQILRGNKNKYYFTPILNTCIYQSLDPCNSKTRHFCAKCIQIKVAQNNFF